MAAPRLPQASQPQQMPALKAGDVITINGKKYTIPSGNNTRTPPNPPRGAGVPVTPSPTASQPVAVNTLQPKPGTSSYGASNPVSQPQLPGMGNPISPYFQLMQQLGQQQQQTATALRERQRGEAVDRISQYNAMSAARPFRSTLYDPQAMLSQLMASQALGNYGRKGSPDIGKLSADLAALNDPAIARMQKQGDINANLANLNNAARAQLQSAQLGSAEKMQTERLQTQMKMPQIQAESEDELRRRAALRALQVFASGSARDPVLANAGKIAP